MQSETKTHEARDECVSARSSSPGSRRAATALDFTFISNPLNWIPLLRFYSFCRFIWAGTCFGVLIELDTWKYFVREICTINIFSCQMRCAFMKLITWRIINQIIEWQGFFVVSLPLSSAFVCVYSYYCCTVSYKNMFGKYLRPICKVTFSSSK